MGRRITGEGPNPGGVCVCGCGEPAPIASTSRARNGDVRGRPLRFIAGHQARKYSGHAKYVERDGKFEHRGVWEKHHGPIPDGMEIHHIDGDKENNAIENLSLVSRREHSRIHAGWKLLDGEWVKPCTTCCSMLPTSEFYAMRSGHNEFSRMCKPCSAADARARRSR